MVKKIFIYSCEVKKMSPIRKLNVPSVEGERTVISLDDSDN